MSTFGEKYYQYRMISVIIPMYNAEKTIKQSLISVKNQTFPMENMEVLVINDGSTDNSRLVVERFIKDNPNVKIILVNQENRGVSITRNVGLKMAKGEYVALLDADDEWLPEKIERQVFYLQNKEIDFISSLMKNYKLLPPYRVGTDHLAEVTFRKLLIRNGIPTPTVLFKRQILEDIGYFDEKQNYAEDANYWLRISEKYKMYILCESLVIAGGGKRTFGVSGLSANLKEMAKGFQKNLKDMYNAKRISYWEYVGYRIFYKMKYLVLITRNYYYSLKK